MAKQSSSAAGIRPPQPTSNAGSTAEPFIDALCQAFVNFTAQFAVFFQSGKHNVVETAKHYVCGLVQADKRNMERMAEAVPGSDHQVLQNFLSHSSWTYRALMDAIARRAYAMLVTIAVTGVSLNIDGSAFAKKGKDSAGVARQWNGRLGKQDNCQFGVFGALVGGNRACLIDGRLFLPKEWCGDHARCEFVGIPREERVYRTHVELALEIVENADRLGLKCGWIGVDSEFGRSLEFLEKLDADGKTFVADVPSNRHIYLEDPAPYLPPQKPGRGRRRVRHHSKFKAVEVGKWVKQQPESRWKEVILRDSTRGNLVAEILHRRVWVWDKDSETAHCWHLVVRREIDSPSTIKYSLCNADAGTHVTRLAQMQASRFWIERSFQDAKSNLGMAQYQARRWDSWHRHMALVMLTALFMLLTRELHDETVPLLSCRDIQELLSWSLPDRRACQRELVRQMESRQQRRQQAIVRYSS
jgi:SRSO17 transposase